MAMFFLACLEVNGFRIPIIGEASDKSKAVIDLCLKILQKNEEDPDFIPRSQKVQIRTFSLGHSFLQYDQTFLRNSNSNFHI